MPVTAAHLVLNGHWADVPGEVVGTLKSTGMTPRQVTSMAVISMAALGAGGGANSAPNRRVKCDVGHM